MATLKVIKTIHYAGEEKLIERYTPGQDKNRRRTQIIFQFIQKKCNQVSWAQRPSQEAQEVKGIIAQFRRKTITASTVCC